MTDCPRNEVWKTVHGTDGLYSVSDRGRVRSEALSCAVSGRQRGRVLKCGKDRKGYLCFVAYLLCGVRRHLKVHRAVAAAFIGECPPGLQVNHKNGDKADNRPENLEYVTCQANIQHGWEHGLYPHRKGEDHNRSKLKEPEILAIRGMYPARSLAAIGDLFGVTKQNVRSIVRRETWAHVA